MKNEKVTIFVYGTLKRGLRLNHYLGQDAELLGGDAIDGLIFDLSGMYPVVFAGEGTVYGEVWEVNPVNYHATKDMELRAGYKERDVITNVFGHKAKVFFGTPALYKAVTGKNNGWNATRCKDGVWLPRPAKDVFI